VFGPLIRKYLLDNKHRCGGGAGQQAQVCGGLERERGVGGRRVGRNNPHNRRKGAIPGTDVDSGFVKGLSQAG